MKTVEICLAVGDKIYALSAQHQSLQRISVSVSVSLYAPVSVSISVSVSASASLSVSVFVSAFVSVSISISVSVSVSIFYLASYHSVSRIDAKICCGFLISTEHL